MKKILNFIDHLESPSLNGIIYPDGTIDLLNVKVDWGPPIQYSLKSETKSSIELLDNEGKLQWNDCAILVTAIDIKQSIEIVAGEGDYGSDGFIGVIDLSTRNLIWLAFFNCSNPFDRLDIKEEKIYATSTNGCLWKFVIKSPIDIEIECSHPGNSHVIT